MTGVSVVPCIGLAIVMTGCGQASVDVPRVATPLGHDTVHVQFDCRTPVPPVVSDAGPLCDPAMVGKMIPEQRVCGLLEALKRKVEAESIQAKDPGSDRWSRVRFVSICRRETPEVVVSVNAVIADSDASGEFFALDVDGQQGIHTGGSWRNLVK